MSKKKKGKGGGFGGLADAFVAHRIWLWGVGATTQILAIVLDMGSYIVVGHEVGTTVFGLVAVSLLGFTGTASIALAFFPPKAYKEMIELRYAEPATA